MKKIFLILIIAINVFAKDICSVVLKSDNVTLVCGRGYYHFKVRDIAQMYESKSKDENYIKLWTRDSYYIEDKTFNGLLRAFRDNK